VLLALDTATASITTCVYDADTDRVLAERNAVGTMKHGELLAPAITGVLADAGLVRQDLTAIVVGVGPGPYTGLRVGVVTARTLGFILDIPVYGVCSLDAIALAAVEYGVAEPFLVTTDARRKELFWASYDERGGRLDGPYVDRPVDIPAGGRLVAGSGPDLYPDFFERGVEPRDPRARDLAVLVATERSELFDPEPIYLRRPDAVAPGKPKPVS